MIFGGPAQYFVEKEEKATVGIQIFDQVLNTGKYVNTPKYCQSLT